MASTPSASALSAVLRVQGNILARKRANKKRPSAAVYGLGVTCGDSVKSSFRSLWGFIFHRQRVEIPGVLSVSVRFESGCSGKSSIRNGESKDRLIKSSPKTDNKMLTRKTSSEPNQWPETKLASENIFAFKSHRNSVLSKNNLVLRLDGTYLRKPSSVSDSVRTQLGWNQRHPDCDKLSGCLKCTSEHHEDQPKTLEGAEPGE